ncbi:2-dehydropantoate 2-reductase [Microcella alkalica]|uniref:2-dehydropantoate 2-reductase n=1 Tax=Microcella alkalica TaxID=355930 RepID=A0A839E3G8_9MICO|nr:2-dehydropantoate 2-reductase [Microcella alkalica]
MRIAVVGAGAIGGVLAALLSRAGDDVVVTARGEHGAAIARDGLELSGGWGSFLARVPVVERVEPPVDLIVLATKAHDSAAALSAITGCDGTPVLVVQNGLGGADAARDALPHSPVAIGFALFAASLVVPGHVSVTGPAPLTLAGDAAAIAVALPALRAALPEEVTVTDDVRGAQWTKLLVNQVNALPAITGLSVQQVVAHDGLRRVLARGMVETAVVGRALGVKWAQLGSVGAAQVEELLADDSAHAERLPRSLAARMGDVPNPASTLQSIRRGRSTEIDALNGAVADAAARLHIPTPVNAAMVALVHEVERTGEFLPPAEVLVRVPRGNDPARTD